MTTKSITILNEIIYKLKNNKRLPKICLTFVFLFIINSSILAQYLGSHYSNYELNKPTRIYNHQLQTYKVLVFENGSFVDSLVIGPEDYKFLNQRPRNYKSIKLVFKYDLECINEDLNRIEMRSIIVPWLEELYFSVFPTGFGYFPEKVMDDKLRRDSLIWLIDSIAVITNQMDSKNQIIESIDFLFELKKEGLNVDLRNSLAEAMVKCWAVKRMIQVNKIRELVSLYLSKKSFTMNFKDQLDRLKYWKLQIDFGNTSAKYKMKELNYGLQYTNRFTIPVNSIAIKKFFNPNDQYVIPRYFKFSYRYLPLSFTKFMDTVEQKFNLVQAGKSFNFNVVDFSLGCMLPFGYIYAGEKGGTGIIMEGGISALSVNKFDILNDNRTKFHLLQSNTNPRININLTLGAIVSFKLYSLYLTRTWYIPTVRLTNQKDYTNLGGIGQFGISLPILSYKVFKYNR